VEASVDKVNVAILELGQLKANTNVISQDDQCIIVDLGGESDRLIDYLKEKGLKPLALLVTHKHYDHIGGVDDFAMVMDLPVYAHYIEGRQMSDPYENLSSLSGRHLYAKASDFLEDGQVIVIGNFKIRAIEISGHTEHSLCYYFPDDGFVITGDTLFNRSIGRTDLHGASVEELVNNIKKKLLNLPDETLVYPGHGPASTIKIEKKLNPYLSKN